MEFYLGEIFKYPSIGKLLDYIIKTDTTFYESEAVRETGLTNKTVSKAIEYLEKIGLIEKERKIGMTQLYKLKYNYMNQNIKQVYASYRNYLEDMKKTKIKELKRNEYQSNNTRISSNNTNSDTTK